MAFPKAVVKLMGLVMTLTLSKILYLRGAGPCAVQDAFFFVFFFPARCRLLPPSFPLSLFPLLFFYPCAAQACSLPFLLSLSCAVQAHFITVFPARRRSRQDGIAEGVGEAGWAGDDIDAAEAAILCLRGAGPCAVQDLFLLVPARRRGLSLYLSVSRCLVPLLPSCAAQAFFFCSLPARCSGVELLPVIIKVGTFLESYVS